MIHTRRHFSLLSHGWLVAALSLVALTGLSVLLWSPWERRGIAGGKPLHFYCAAGMTRPVEEIIENYKKEYGIPVQASYAGSGQLLSQIESVGGRGDLYLAADTSHMRIAQQKGLVAEAIPVAIIRPVLIVNRATQEALQKEGRPVASVNDLLRDDLKVVLANPELASIGQLTRDRLKPLGIWAKLEAGLRDGSARVSTVGTVNEVAQVVRTRDRYVGIVWSAVAQQYDELKIVHVPEFDGVTEQIMIGVLAKSEQPTAALQFARYLTARDRGAAIFQKYNFEPMSDADDWAEVPEIRLAAGAMLKPGVEGAIKAFERREGARVETNFAGCGLLVSQMKGMKEGGPAGKKFPDAYFACDVSFLDDVRQWFDRPVRVAQNDLVLIVAKGNPKGVKPSLQELARKDLRIGVPHPTHSALGKLTDDLLKKHGWYEQVYTADWRERIVHTDAAHDLVNKLRAGALDLAVVYRSNARSTPGNVEKYLDILEVNLDGARATQPFAIAKETRHRYLVQRLFNTLVAEQSAERFQALGFHWVYEAPAASTPKR
jgi:molybdenum ABC transporter molybdate-binding protein